MIKVISVQICPWKKAGDFILRQGEYKTGDTVIVEEEKRVEAGAVKNGEKEMDESDLEEKPGVVIRKATSQDLKKIQNYKAKRTESLDICRRLIKEYKLPMKLVDMRFSFDGSQITFAFIADRRVDFRELVKNLSRHFQRSIRLEQIGSRDEAAAKKGCGICGRPLCCASFLKEKQGISLDLARIQQMAHRGSERITGLCGRLMCCLAYEGENYEQLLKTMPELGSEVKTRKGKAKVVSRNVLQQKVQVELEDGTKDECGVKEIKW